MPQKEFVEVFDKVTEAVAKHEKGNVVYGLSKPLDDDVTFYAYAGRVWATSAVPPRTHPPSCTCPSRRH